MTCAGGRDRVSPSNQELEHELEALDSWKCGISNLWDRQFPFIPVTQGTNGTRRQPGVLESTWSTADEVFHRPLLPHRARGGCARVKML